MSLENLKTTFQILIYIGTGVSIFGSILIMFYPAYKLKLAFNIPMGISIVIMGAILLLVSTIYFDKYSVKIKNKYETDFDKKLADRDEVIRKNNEKLQITNRFYAEIDNPIKSLFFILDLGSTTLGDNFNDFSCVIRFDLLDITAQYRTIHYENHPPSENTVHLETRIVKGKNLENLPFVGVQSGSFKNISEFYINLMFIENFLPEGFSIRDISEQRFYFYLSEKQTSLVKGIKLNANNWDIFNKRENNILWRELKQDWLPDRKDLKVFYQEYQTRFYDYNYIQFFKGGFSYYEIVQSNIDTSVKLILK